MFVFCVLSTPCITTVFAEAVFAVSLATWSVVPPPPPVAVELIVILLPTVSVSNVILVPGTRLRISLGELATIKELFEFIVAKEFTPLTEVEKDTI